MPELEYITCPIHRYLDCMKEMDRNEFAAHLGFYHPEYQDDPEPFFDAERARRNA